MINEEIGTYPIIAALDIEPMLPLVEINPEQVKAHLNNKEYIGNRKVILQMYPDIQLNITTELEEVKISRSRTAVQVLGEDFGIEYDDDWLQCMERPEEIWKEAQALADEQEDLVEKIETNFEFSDSDDEPDDFFEHWE